MRELFSTFQKEWQMYGVLQNTAEGVVFTLNHSMKVENLIMLPAGAVVGVIAAIAVPNMLTAAQKAKQRATMADMKQIATAIALYTAEKGQPPPGNSINEIAKLLEPAYLKQFPRKDRWGHDFIYSRKPGKKSIYFLASAGKEGLFKGFDQKGFYPVTGMSDFDNDIILANGEFVFAPKLK